MSEPFGVVTLQLLAHAFVRMGIACNTAQLRMQARAAKQARKTQSKAETFSKLLKRIRAQEPASLPGYLERVK
jgi:hypothetical protein